MWQKFRRHLGKLGLFGGGGLLVSVCYNTVTQFYPLTGYQFITQSWARFLFWFFIVVGASGIILITIALYRNRNAVEQQPKEIIISLKSRRRETKLLKQVLADYEERMDAIRSEVEKVPLSYYETNYLSGIEGYKQFKSKYPTESEAQYVALGQSFFLQNPLFEDKLGNDSEMKTLLSKLEQTRSQLPDSKLNDFLDTFLKAKQLQAVVLIYHRLFPSKLTTNISNVLTNYEADEKIGNTVKEAKKHMERRLMELWNGAKYE